MEEYCTVRGILSKFESWRETDMDAYTEAYLSLCLPKIISPIIRLQLVTWNPIMVFYSFFPITKENYINHTCNELISNSIYRKALI